MAKASCGPRSTFVNAPPKRTTVLCRATGKATSSWGSACTRWPPSWNARAASSCWSRCQTVTPLTSSPTRSRARSPSFPTNFVDRSPGTKAKRWPRTHASPSRPTSLSTSVIRAALGSAVRTRTPTGCCANTSRSAPRSLTTPRPTSTLSLQNSTTGLDKPSAGGHHHKHSTKHCDDPLRPPELRAVLGEAAGIGEHERHEVRGGTEAERALPAPLLTELLHVVAAAALAPQQCGDRVPRVRGH